MPKHNILKQTTTMIFKFSLLTILLVSILGCDSPATNKLPESKIKRQGQTVDVGIATFTCPDGWVALPPKGNTKALVVRKGVRAETLEEQLSIEIGLAKENSAESTSKAIAEEYGGKVANSLILDGIDGFRISYPPDYKNLQPRECIVVHKGNQACFIFGGSKSKDKDVWTILQKIADSWKWK